MSRQNYINDKVSTLTEFRFRPRARENTSAYNNYQLKRVEPFFPSPPLWRLYNPGSDSISKYKYKKCYIENSNGLLSDENKNKGFIIRTPDTSVETGFDEGGLAIVTRTRARVGSLTNPEVISYSGLVNQFAWVWVWDLWTPKVKVIGDLCSPCL